jgi:hypothetical protein
VPTYEVAVRGTAQLGELGALNLNAAKDLAHHSINAATPQEAGREALAGLDPLTSPMLVYVWDQQGGATVYWPSGEPLTYARRPFERFEEGYCYLQVARGECVGLGSPEGETAVFVEGAPLNSGWVCDACASLVAPGL